MMLKKSAMQNCPTAQQWSSELSRDAMAPRMLAHLEQCSHCQQALDALAAEPTLWQEVHETLADREVDLHHITESIVSLAVEPTQVAIDDPMCEYELAQLQNLLPINEADGAPGTGRIASYPPAKPIARIGRYELEQLIGRGGMGLVFRAWDTQLHRVVAVKTLSMTLWSMPSARERFIREGRAAAMLNHPHIVPLYDVINDPPVPALVMQYIAGPTLDQWIKERGTLPWQQALRVGLQLTEALCAAHSEGLVHRDIKPGNVLLEADGTRALLTDFGLVRAMDDVTLTQSGLLAGTPHFMSPEQARGEDVDGRSDLFSLGALLYYAMAGQTPFRGRESMAVLNVLCHTPHRSLAAVQPEVPIEVSRLIDRLLSKSASQRPASSVELRDTFKRLIAAESRLHVPRRRQPMSKRFAVSSSLSLLAVFLYLLPGWLVPSSSRPSGKVPIYHSTNGIPDYADDLMGNSVILPANDCASNESTDANDAPVEHFQFARTHTVDQLNDSAMRGYELESQIDQLPEFEEFSAIGDVGLSREALQMQSEIDALQQQLQIPTSP